MSKRGPEPESSSSSRAPKAGSKGPLTFSGIGDLVTFLVGPNKVPIQLHKKIVCHYSPILNAAFNSAFIEGATQTYELKSVSESTFALFTQWIYSQRLERVPCTFEEVSRNPKKTILIADESTAFVSLWVLADMLLIPRLQNLAIDIIFELGRLVSNKTGIIYAYKNTAVDSPLRKMFASQAAWTSSIEVLESHGPNLPREFMLDVIKACRTIMLQNATALASSETCISKHAADFHVKEE